MGVILFSIVEILLGLSGADDGIDAFSVESEKKNSCELRSIIKIACLSAEHKTKLSEMLEKHNDKVENKNWFKNSNQTSNSFEKRKSCVFSPRRILYSERDE